MEDRQQEESDYGEMLRYGIWSLGAGLTWIVASLLPPVRENAVFFAWFNVIMMLLVLPAVLLAVALAYFGYRSNFLGSSVCLLIAIAIGEILNLIPFNPFALGLPYCLLCQCQNFASLGHFKAAEICARRVVMIWNQDRNSHWHLSALTCLASALEGQGRYAETNRVVQTMFKIVESDTKGNESQAVALTDFAGNLSRMGLAKEAIEIAERALGIWNGIPNLTNDQLSLFSLALSQMGLAYECDGNYRSALEFYRKALSVKIQVHGDDSQEIAIGLNNVGYALTETGQFDEALEKLEKARKILANTQMEKTAIWTHLLENLGDLHRSMGNFEDAEKQLLESFELRKKRFKEDLHHSYHNLGKLYRDTKEWEKAQSYFEKAIALREDRFKASTAQTLKEFAKLMQAMEKNAEATIMQQRAEGLLAKTE